MTYVLFLRTRKTLACSHLLNTNPNLKGQQSKSTLLLSTTTSRHRNAMYTSLLSVNFTFYHPQLRCPLVPTNDHVLELLVIKEKVVKLDHLVSFSLCFCVRIFHICLDIFQIENYLLPVQLTNFSVLVLCSKPKCLHYMLQDSCHNVYCVLYMQSLIFMPTTCRAWNLNEKVNKVSAARRPYFSLHTSS